jgi:hypothetical protein
MVCDKCTDRLSKVCVPDKWKDGAVNTGTGDINVCLILLIKVFSGGRRP